MEVETAIEIAREMDCENCKDKSKCNFNDLANCYAREHMKISQNQRKAKK